MIRASKVSLPGVWAVIGLLWLPWGHAAEVILAVPSGLPAPARHGLAAMTAALTEAGAVVRPVADPGRIPAGKPAVVAGLADGPWFRTPALAGAIKGLPQSPESLAIRRVAAEGGPMLVLAGRDGVGLMYAALEVADAVRAAGADWESALADLPETVESPFLEERAVSMYTMHRGWFERRLHDEDHWRRYFDLLARSRINSFVVIFGYENGGFMAPPYPFFFDVPGFPEVEMVGLDAAGQEANRQAFQRLIDLAHERGIRVTPAIWDHIYRGGVQGGGIAGANERVGRRVPGLVAGVTAGNLLAYTKAAIARFLEVFPDIDGLQFRMHGESGLRRDEMAGFWHEVFRLIRERRPDLRLDLRAKGLPDGIIADAVQQGLRIRVATKYWMEQMGLPFHPTHVNPPNQHDRRHGYADLLKHPRTFAVHWRLWSGGTARLLLWADPEYVARFARSCRLGGGNSCEVNEMLATWMLGEPHEAAPRLPWADTWPEGEDPFDRYWPFYVTWGRWTYDPECPATVLEREFRRRFGAAGPHVMAGLRVASRILPRIVAAAYPYRLFPTTRGWAEMMAMGDLERYARLECTDVEQFQSPAEAARLRLEGQFSAKRSPEETAARLRAWARAALREVDLAGNPGDDRELALALADLRILAHLAEFHAARLPAAVAWQLFQASGDLAGLDEALAGEGAALAAWERIVAAAGDHYSTNLAFGVHRVGFPRHWKEELGTLRASVERLERLRRSVEAAGPADGPALAHVPVRRVRPPAPLVLKATPRTGGGAVRAFIREDGPGGGAYEVPLARLGTRLWQTTFRPAAATRRIEYWLEWSRPDGGRERSPVATNETWTVVISGDREPPRVAIEPPSQAVPGRDLPVVVTVSEAGEVERVRLRYRHLTQFEDYRTAAMTALEGGRRWRGVIPGGFITPEWDVMFYIEAVDAAGNGRMWPDADQEMPYVVAPLTERTGP